MKILVIEDEHRIANSIKKGLELNRYTVDVAYDGRTGFDLGMDKYDTIILDLMLPDIPGYEICEKLRHNGINTPILILTAKGQLEDKLRGFDIGADDYLTKPFSFEELLARIKALTRRPQTISQEILIADDLSLNTNTFQVQRQGKDITLSNKEFCLLEFLLRNKGKIFSKEQIIENVWDYNSDILPNTVEVFIRNLRQKIDLPYKNKKPLLITIRGFGYKIDR